MTEDDFWDAAVLTSLRAGMAPVTAAEMADLACDLRAARLQKQAHQGTVVVLNGAGLHRIEVIKVIHKYLPLSLRDAKEATEQLPWEAPPMPVSRAEQFIEDLRAAGADVAVLNSVHPASF